MGPLDSEAIDTETHVKNPPYLGRVSPRSLAAPPGRGPPPTAADSPRTPAGRPGAFFRVRGPGLRAWGGRSRVRGLAFRVKAACLRTRARRRASTSFASASAGSCGQCSETSCRESSFGEGRGRCACGAARSWTCERVPRALAPTPKLVFPSVTRAGSLRRAQLHRHAPFGRCRIL